MYKILPAGPPAGPTLNTWSLANTAVVTDDALKPNNSVELPIVLVLRLVVNSASGSNASPKSEPFNERQTVDVEIEDQSKKSNKKSKFGGWT